MKLLKLILVVFLQLHNTEEPTPVSSSVIIIGAGPAGIAAATRLLENGQKNILILEAENRIGGRINSVFFGEAYIDLGAEWCHGDNVVYDLVKEFNILQHTKIGKIVYHSNKNIDQEFGKELIDLMETIYVPDGHRDEEEGETLGQYCIDKYNATIHERYYKIPEKLEVAKASTDLFHHYVLSSEGAFSWYEPSAKNDYKDAVGANYDWNGLGYKTVLEVLMKQFPDPSKQLPLTVLFNKEVVKIFWNKSSLTNSVTVHCSDQTTFEADHVIFTPSIGVLKEKHETLFSPSLPKSKQKAIRQIGFGAVMKVVMHFKSRWWPKSNFTEFNFVWDVEDRTSVSKEFQEGPTKEGRSWLTELFSIMPVAYNPNVLIGWITGDMVPQIELIANETLVDGIRFILDKFLGNKYNVTKPDSIIRTSWYTNPHFRGSYSYQTIEARKNNITAEMELSKPLLNLEGRPIVLFAGEASHPYFYSTVHGAIETGFREADRIIDSYK